jgi:hypothetical protein
MNDTFANSTHLGRSNGNGAAGDIAELLPPGLEETLRASDERARAFIREHPVPVVLGALALGFVGARLFRSD